jgi:murein DD-endopeptidase MepM/ murein hydrolase activator NlpD
VYRLCNAIPRALFLGLAIVAIALAIGGTALADESTPRAVPQARSYPRTFGSYDTLIAYATTIAADQNALDARVAAVRDERNLLSATLSADGAVSGRGGRLFDPDARRDERSAIATASARVSSLVALDKSVTAAGALTTSATPWRMPSEGEITQPFGPTSLWVEPARVWGGLSYRHFHEGVDIAGAWGADVLAPARGRVVYVGTMMDGAEVVVLAHDGGVVTMYAHLNNTNQPPPVAAGDEVAAGQKIGTQGLTGIITGMHLHWAAWRNGELIDPMSLIGH